MPLGLAPDPQTSGKRSWPAAVGWETEFPDETAFVVPKTLRAMVEKGDFGRKSGKGFYVWDGDKPMGPA